MFTSIRILQNIFSVYLIRVIVSDTVICLMFLWQKGPETKKSEILVLDPKRSNAINIGMTVLPAVHVIKTAILNFDEFAISKEGIEVRPLPVCCSR